jgi:hypothetical protein
LLAQYARNARVIEEGSGIKNLDEIVTTLERKQIPYCSCPNQIILLARNCFRFGAELGNTHQEVSAISLSHNDEGSQEAAIITDEKEIVKRSNLSVASIFL